ncbi:AraC family transcriptional regulator [Desmospora sp. 8437]|nr:AraC family transcriptional regulator [Desmospora sp. 8437]
MAESPIPTGTEESPSELKRTDGAEGPAFFDRLYMCRDLFAKIVGSDRKITRFSGKKPDYADPSSQPYPFLH